MKHLFLVLVSFVTLFFLVSCESEIERNGYKENVVKELYGVWDIQSNEGLQGTIEFTYDMQIKMTTVRGNVPYADYSLIDIDNVIVITYAEDGNGEYLLTEEDEENGGIFCIFEPIDEKNTYIKGLPLYGDEKLLLIKH